MGASRATSYRLDPAIKERLAARFHVDHATVEIEGPDDGPCGDC